MSLMKEVFRLRRKIGKLTDGQVSLGDLRPDEEFTNGSLLDLVIAPNAGLYKGGRFAFLIVIPAEYPNSEESPDVFSNCDILHPNIDTTEKRSNSSTTNICLNMLDYNTWDNSFGLVSIVHGILFLMHNPNFSDPLSPFFDPSDCKAGEESVKQFMTGEEVEGLKLSRNIENIDDDIGENSKETSMVILEGHFNTKEYKNTYITNRETEGKKDEFTNIARWTHDVDNVNHSDNPSKHSISGRHRPDVGPILNVCLDGTGEIDKMDTEVSGLQMIIIDGEAFLAPQDIPNDLHAIKATATGTNDMANVVGRGMFSDSFSHEGGQTETPTSNKETRDEKVKKEIMPYTNDTEIAVGRDVVLNENEVQHTGSNIGVVLTVKTKNVFEFPGVTSCERCEKEEKLPKLHKLECVCFNQTRKITLIDKAFLHFRTVRRRVLLFFGTYR